MENIYEQWRKDETLVQQESSGHSINSTIFQSVPNSSGFSGVRLCTLQYKHRGKYLVCELPVQGMSLKEAALSSRKIPAGSLDKADPGHGTMKTCLVELMVKPCQ